ncbi:hypothetical protein CsSME_00050027 [Camellia sinensis var. sinensis]
MSRSPIYRLLWYVEVFLQSLLSSNSSVGSHSSKLPFGYIGEFSRDVTTWSYVYVCIDSDPYLCLSLLCFGLTWKIFLIAAPYSGIQKTRPNGKHKSDAAYSETFVVCFLELLLRPGQR